MSVPEGKRGTNKFEVLLKARDLCVYTTQICTNTNVFLPQYQNALTNKIIQSATDIFVKCWTANNIRVVTEEDKLNRRRLQDEAHLECNNLLALMQIAQGLFHLPTKRIKYWGGKTLDVRVLISKWIEADSKRYKSVA